jgi:hypothetical protein
MGPFISLFIVIFISSKFKMVETQICEVDALPAPFSLGQQWVGIV